MISLIFFVVLTIMLDMDFRRYMEVSSLDASLKSGRTIKILSLRVLPTFGCTVPYFRADSTLAAANHNSFFLR